MRYSKEYPGEPHPLRGRVFELLGSFLMLVLLLGVAECVAVFVVAIFIFILMDRVNPALGALWVLTNNWDILLAVPVVIMTPLTCVGFMVSYEKTESFEQMVVRRLTALEKKLESVVMK